MKQEKSDIYKIPTNFRMANGYRKRFLFIANGIRMEIEAKPPNSLKLTTKRINKADKPDWDGVALNQQLDWIGEAVERIRFECSTNDNP